ncbi:testis-specific expressed protein 55 isoform 2-T2 [Thomomys bottae]
MDQPPEDEPAESWKQGNPTTPSTAGQKKNREDIQKDHAKGKEVKNQTNADHTAQSSPDQPYGTTSNQTGQIDQSGQTRQEMYELTRQKLSKETERKNTQQAEWKFSSQTEIRTSQTTDHKISQPSERRASEKSSGKLPSSDGRGSAQTDYRFPSLSGQGTSRLSGKTDQVNRRTGASTDDTEFRGEQSAGPFIPDMDEERENDIFEEDAREDYTPPYNEAFSQLEDQIFTELVGGEQYFRIEPCKFEDSSSNVKDQLSVSTEVEIESTMVLPTYRPIDVASHSAYQVQGQVISHKLPTISSKAAYLPSQEGVQTTQGDFSGGVFDASSFQDYGRFPSIVYEDPYQIALQYMEKHRILQIFQITENLVYEKPDDPLLFMLYQGDYNQKRPTVRSVGKNVEPTKSLCSEGRTRKWC